MRVRPAMSKLLAIGLLALSAQGASALFVSSGSASFGKNSLVADTDSGLTWLDLDVTAGLSFNQVVALLDQDPLFGDFRLASLAEVVDLFGHAGFSVDVPTGDPSDPSRLAANASFAKAFTGVRTKGAETFRGYTGEPGLPIDPEHGVYSLQVAGVGVRHGGKSASVAFTDEVSYFSDLAYGGVGSWLVLDPPPALLRSTAPTVAAVTPVPEPSTYALMLAGLVMLAATVRHRRATLTLGAPR